MFTMLIENWINQHSLLAYETILTVILSFRLINFSIVCPAGSFRSAEVPICTPCPTNSKANKAGASFCNCLNGHYRHPLDGKHMACHKPPGAPKNLSLLFVDQTSAILSWNVPIVKQDPSNQQFRNDIVFKVKCITCANNVVINPSNDIFNETRLTLTNLEPVTTYTVQIHSVYGPSYSTSTGKVNFTVEPTESPLKRGGSGEMKTEFAEITFTTESAVMSTVFNIRIDSATSKEVELSWEKPLHNDSPIEYYEVRWFPKNEVDAVNKTSVSTKETRVVITELVENMEYGFQVRCKTVSGWGAFSNILYAQTLQDVSQSEFFVFLALLQ